MQVKLLVPQEDGADIEIRHVGKPPPYYDEAALLLTFDEAIELHAKLNLIVTAKEDKPNV